MVAVEVAFRETIGFGRTLTCEATGRATVWMSGDSSPLLWGMLASGGSSMLSGILSTGLVGGASGESAGLKLPGRFL